MSTGPLSADTAEKKTEVVSKVDGLEDARRRRFTQRQLRWLLPLAALAVAMVIYGILELTGPSAQEEAPQPALPLVRVEVAVPQNLRLNVKVHGVVTPRTESDLVAETRRRRSSSSHD